MNEVTVKKDNLPADISGMGLEDLNHEDIPKKYISSNKDTGIISINNGTVELANPKTQFQITPLFMYWQWDYLPKGEAKAIRKELIHPKNHNVALTDGEILEIDGVQVERVKSLTLLVLVQDREFDGPMFLSLRKSKLWAAQSTLLSRLMENKEKKFPIFGQRFYVGSEQKTNKKNQKFYVYSFKPSEVITNSDKLMNHLVIYQALKRDQDKLLAQIEDGEGQE